MSIHMKEIESLLGFKCTIVDEQNVKVEISCNYPQQKKNCSAAIFMRDSYQISL